MSSFFPGTEKSCPHCGSSDSKTVRQKGWLKGELTLCLERICKKCGTVFEPPAGIHWPIIAIGMGVLLIVMAVSECISNARQLGTANKVIDFVDHIWNIGRHAMFTIGGLYILFVGWRGLKRKTARIIKPGHRQ